MAVKEVALLERSVRQQPDNMPSMHVHAHHEVYFLLAGQRRYFIGHTIYDVTPGNLVFIPAGQLHRTTTPTGVGYERYLLSFDEADTGALTDAVGRDAWNHLLHSGCLQLPPEAARQVQRILEQLEQELTRALPYGEAVMGHLLQAVLLTALRFGKPKPPSTAESADKVQEVARYISENFSQELTLEDAAKMACMERTYFSKRFKKLTGVGFYEYLTKTRLTEAQRLLTQTQLPVGEIAERCGFSSGNYFGDVLRSYTGLSPTAWRRRTEK